MPFADALTLLALKGLVGSLALGRGFTHVSDDDFSRVVIAESFAVAPRWDPSGTSWLPFPFWLHRAGQVLFGRGLETARLVGMALGATSAVVVYAAAHAATGRRRVALAAALLGTVVPWNVWLGLSPVPEGFVGAWAAAALLLCRAPEHSVGRAGRPLAATLALAASFSRYEAWPVAAVVAATLAFDGLHEARCRAERAVAPFSWVVVAAAGPVAWMAWNRIAHGSATHFLFRVATYRASHGFAPAALSERLLGYPRALWAAAPELAVAGLAGAAVVLTLPNVMGSSAGAASSGRAARRALGPSFMGMAAMTAFLVEGDVRDGAPTHHAVRALTPLLWSLPVWAATAGAELVARVESRHGRPVPGGFRMALAVVATLGFSWAVGRDHGESVPGTTAAEDRTRPLTLGEALRRTRPEGFTVSPCAYEHFALIAAYGAPERVQIAPSHTPSGTGDGDCPRIE